MYQSNKKHLTFIDDEKNGEYVEIVLQRMTLDMLRITYNEVLQFRQSTVDYILNHIKQHYNEENENENESIIIPILQKYHSSLLFHETSFSRNKSNDICQHVWSQVRIQHYPPHTIVFDDYLDNFDRQDISHYIRQFILLSSHMALSNPKISFFPSSNHDESFHAMNTWNTSWPSIGTDRFHSIQPKSSSSQLQSSFIIPKPKVNHFLF